MHGFNTEGARLLAEAGADVNAATRKGETPLKAAEETGQKECAELIREALR